MVGSDYERKFLIERNGHSQYRPVSRRMAAATIGGISAIIVLLGATAWRLFHPHHDLYITLGQPEIPASQLPQAISNHKPKL